MVQLTLLTSTLLMGVLLVLTAAAVVAGRNWRGYSASEGPSAAEVLGRLARSPRVWILGFFLLCGLAAGGAVMLVTGASIPMGASALTLVGGFLVAVVALYFLWGVYHSSRYRGFNRASAVAVTVWVVGAVGIVVISLRLLGFV